MIDKLLHVYKSRDITRQINDTDGITASFVGNWEGESRYLVRIFGPDKETVEKEVKEYIDTMVSI